MVGWLLCFGLWVDCYFWLLCVVAFPWLLVNSVGLDTSFVFGYWLPSWTWLLFGCCVGVSGVGSFIRAGLVGGFDCLLVCLLRCNDCGLICLYGSDVLLGGVGLVGWSVCVLLLAICL